MLIVPRSVSVFVLSVLLIVCHHMAAQPDLARWSRMVTDLEAHGWVTELEALEPGCILGARSPELRVTEWPARSPWADQLVSELEALPGAEDHADRALQRLLENGMRRFQLVEAQADRSRPAMETLLETAGLAVEWALLPMALTGWDISYYGPDQRAGAWAMDLSTAHSSGLNIQPGWDERHLAERMNPVMVNRIHVAQQRHPNSPLLQILDVVQGKDAALRFQPAEAEMDLLDWLHLLRVWLQVDRSFQRDRLDALWLLRDKQWEDRACPSPSGASHFKSLAHLGMDVRLIRFENPWYTTDSIGWTTQRPGLRIPSHLSALISDTSWREWCECLRAWPHDSVTQDHVVQSGEVLGTIARRHGVRIEEVQAWNDLAGDQIQVGQILHLNIPESPSLPAQNASNARSAAEYGEKTFRWHEVQPGETYWSIAQQFSHVDLMDLLNANPVPPEQLQAGAKIRIPWP